MLRIFSQYVSAKTILLLPLEGALIVFSFLLATKLNFWNDPTSFEVQTLLPDFALQCLICVALLQLCFYYQGLYERRSRNRAEQFARLVQSLGSACLLLGFLCILAPTLLFGRDVVIVAITLVLISTSVARVLFDVAWQFTAPKQNVLILGTGELAMSVAREMSRREDLGFNLRGFIPEAPIDCHAQRKLLGRPVIGSAGEIERLAKLGRISRIIVALQEHCEIPAIRDLVRLRSHGVRVEDAPTAIAALTGRIAINIVQPSAIIYGNGFCGRSVTTWKRALDITLSLVGLIVSAPVMVFVALLIWLETGRPILYRQTRVGMRGRRFELLKFRSMRIDAEAGTGPQWAQVADPRVTWIGAFLRKYHLDELPQFWNVIRGQMSFVGPRPERPVFVEQLSERIPIYDERHSVRPGITGWAQIEYRYAASIEDSVRKLEYDLFYVKHMSFAFDCAIVFQTVREVLFGRGGNGVGAEV